MAQLVERQSHNLKVASSSLAGGTNFLCLFLVRILFKGYSTYSEGRSMVAKFLNDLYEMVQHNIHPHILQWDCVQQSIQIRKKSEFIQLVLPHYFPHHSFQSFTRQLNMYGFARQTNPHDPHALIIRHDAFQLGRPDRLLTIKRKSSIAHYRELERSHNQSLDDNMQSVEQKLQHATAQQMQLERQLQFICEQYDNLVRDVETLEAAQSPETQLDSIAASCGYKRKAAHFA